METIDFSQIRSLSGGQRYSFEELVCQLARRESFAAGSTFRRVEGSGGDGGVEGYWLFSDGSKHGYQAKYFTRTRDIDWAQIDHSVYEALKNHPSLKRYVIAIPCDLTDRTGATGKGRTGWQHWEAHKKSGLRNIGDDIQKLLLSHGPRSSYETFLLHRRQMACVVIGLGKRNFPQSGLSAMPRRR